jgi:hypothetical protein
MVWIGFGLVALFFLIAPMFRGNFILLCVAVIALCIGLAALLAPLLFLATH